ncbi:hypothetical protein AB840_14510 [Megasphaera cerevisiae DSM 20462]|uniref:Uncharacterized protein n=1 Tax=Megasphaera cerevisiae DSM 20462 TaxID=1122219 RepID=A0A0J6WPE1_9FIRM|nr:hypothetical protein [Megasphaera cerevisiae]KMO85270.1 hypothetical protein AB840_14510 [Megasphaera cerevisiae DSM 20462]
MALLDKLVWHPPNPDISMGVFFVGFVGQVFIEALTAGFITITGVFVVGAVLFALLQVFIHFRLYHLLDGAAKKMECQQ